MPRKLVFNLRDPKFSIYHRAGLAGLAASLKTLSSDIVRHSASDLTLGLEYDVTDFEALDHLLHHAFPLDSDGRALGRGLFTHIGFSETLLQIPSLRKLIENTKSLIDGVEYGWIRLGGYRHQSVARSLVNNKGEFKRKTLRVKGWMLPGATGGQYCEEVETLLPLLFAPMVYTWFDVYSQTLKRGGKALVVPRVSTLKDFSAYSPETPQEWEVSSIAEAVLNYSLKTNLSCEGKLFGSVAWDKHQKHIREKAEINNLDLMDTWRAILEFTASRISDLPDGRKIVTTSVVREMTARNLIAGRPLYMNFVHYHEAAAKNDREACQGLGKLLLSR
jgi:hypothetical protein